MSSLIESQRRLNQNYLKIRNISTPNNTNKHRRSLLSVILATFGVSLLLFSLSFSQEINTKKVIVCFDDGYYSVYKYAYPVLKQYNIPMVCALISSYVGSGKSSGYNSAYSYMRTGDIQEMIDSLNIEVASHSVTHPDLTKLSDEQAEFELVFSKKTLDSLFNQETITFVYPYGAVNRRIIEMTKRAGYKLGRCIRRGEPNLWVDRYLIPVKDVRMSTSVDEVVRHINYHKVTVLMFHRLTPQPTVFTEWDNEQFTSLIRILAADERVEFITFRDLYQQWWQDIMRRYLIQKGWLQNSSMLFQKIDIDQVRTVYPRISQ